MKTDLFLSCGHCWVFQICSHIECGTFTVSSFRIWNSSTGIPSPPLALFGVMLPKAHLTLHSRMSGSRWVITPWQLSGSLGYFLYSSSVYSCYLFFFFFFCHLFLISSASVKSTLFLSFIVPIFAWNVPLVSLIFLKRSLDCPILLLSAISLQCSLKADFLAPLAIPWNSAFSSAHLSLSPLSFAPLLCSSSFLFVRPSQTTILLSCISFSLKHFWSPPPVQCYKPQSIVLQALCLPDLIPWIYPSPPLYNHKRLDVGHTWIV